MSQFPEWIRIDKDPRGGYSNFAATDDSPKYIREDVVNTNCGLNRTSDANPDPFQSINIYTVFIDNDSGGHFLIATSRKELDQKLAAWCRKRWHAIRNEENVPESPDGLDNETTIIQYFEAHTTHWCASNVQTLRIPHTPELRNPDPDTKLATYEKLHEAVSEIIETPSNGLPPEIRTRLADLLQKSVAKNNTNAESETATTPDADDSSPAIATTELTVSQNEGQTFAVELESATPLAGGATVLDYTIPVATTTLTTYRAHAAAAGRAVSSAIANAVRDHGIAASDLECVNVCLDNGPAHDYSLTRYVATGYYPNEDGNLWTETIHAYSPEDALFIARCTMGDNAGYDRSPFEKFLGAIEKIHIEVDKEPYSKRDLETALYKMVRILKETGFKLDPASDN